MASMETASRPFSGEQGSFQLCVVLAIISGGFMTFSAIVVAYPAQRCAREHRKQSARSKCLSVLANMSLTGAAIGLSIVAVGYGPVAVATPVAIGSNLLSNMMLQSFLGIAKYTKDMRVGTMVLAASVTLLTNIGPKDIPATTSVLDQLCRPTAACFVGLLGVLILSCSCLLANGSLHDNTALLFLYATLGGASSVLNTAITKAVQYDLPLALKTPLLIVYVVLSCLGLGVGAKANGSLDDPSLFIPIGAGVNLILTCVAGLLIWGDGSRLEFPLSYGMVYVLVVLGTYLLSSFDLFNDNSPQIAEGRQAFVSGIANKGAKIMRKKTFDLNDRSLQHSFDKYSLGFNSLQKLRELRMHCEQGSSDDKSAEVLLKKRLQECLLRRKVSHAEIANLCVELMRDPTNPEALQFQSFDRWLEQISANHAEGDYSDHSLESVETRLLSLSPCASV